MTKSRYVEVRRGALLGLLEGAGFEAGVEGREVVYRRKHRKDPTMMVKVYTSLSAGAPTARGCGEDAIRVVLVFQNPRTGRSGCLHKCRRVYRTGTEQAVLERLLARMREATRPWNDDRESEGGGLVTKILRGFVLENRHQPAVVVARGTPASDVRLLGIRLA
jgi:hypothetical protein